MQQSLKDSEEFKKIAYQVVKNRRLVDPYARVLKSVSRKEVSCALPAELWSAP